MLALYEVADRMAADPEDHRHTVLWCSRSEDRRGSVLDPPLRGAARGQRPHPHQPARRAFGRAHLRDARARRLVRPDRPGGRPRGPARRRTRRPDLPGRRGARRAGGGAVARARRRQPVRLPAAGDPLPRAAPAEAGSRAGDGRAARRDRGAHHGGRRADARTVLVAARGQRGGGRDARAARRADPRAGRRPAAHPRLAVHRRRGHVPVRDAVALAGRRRARARRASWCIIDRIPFPRPDDPVQLRAVRRDREGGRQRLPGRLRARTRRCSSRRAPAG